MLVHHATIKMLKINLNGFLKTPVNTNVTLVKLEISMF